MEVNPPDRLQSRKCRPVSNRESQGISGPPYFHHEHEQNLVTYEPNFPTEFQLQAQGEAPEMGGKSFPLVNFAEVHAWRPLTRSGGEIDDSHSPRFAKQTNGLDTCGFAEPEVLFICRASRKDLPGEVHLVII